MSKTDAERIIALRENLAEESYYYHVLNSPRIADAEYDERFRDLAELEKEHPEMADPNSPTARVGSPVPSGLASATHAVPMLSLDNVNSLEEALKFFAGHQEHEVTIEMKIDGMSLHVEYREGRLVRALTRGDGTSGQDVTENARTLRTLPLVLRQPVSVAVRGEAYWRISAFNAFNARQPDAKKLANPRNGASGAMQRRDSKLVADCRLDFVAYAVASGLPPAVETQEGLLEYLDSLGFQSTMALPVTRDMAALPYLTCVANAEELEPAIQAMDAYRQCLDLDTDGLVIKLSSLALQQELGAGTHAPKWAAAYKFPPEVKESLLTGVVVQVGRTGQITPVAEIEPVSLGGVTVRRASLCNQDELDRLGIDIGDYVKVVRRGAVIPKIVGLARPSPTKKDPNSSYQFPKCCPACGTSLQKALEKEVHFFCPNQECPDQVFGRLVYAVGENALDIDGCGEMAIRLLMAKARVCRLSDLFALRDFGCLKTAAARKLREGLEAAKNAPLWRKLSALSIPGVGVETCQALAHKFSSPVTPDGQDADLSPLSRISLYQSVLVELINPSAAQSLMSFLRRNIVEVERLADLGFHFEADLGMAGALAGKVFCITGALSTGSRPEISALIRQHGGVVKGSVTSQVNFLVRGPGGGAGKAGGAAKHGTQTITEEELYRMLGLPMNRIEKNVDP